MEMMDIITDKAFDGLQAMSLIKMNRYDAIISDIRMPNMDGKKLFAEAIKFDPEYNKRFIFMSGDLVRDTTQAFVKTITCPFLAKPFALHQMHKLVVPLLDRYSEGKI
jgi:two-component system NtrC family sensor kinase